MQKQILLDQNARIEVPSSPSRDLTGLSDRALVESIERTVAAEREHTARVLEHLRELERRRLYARLGYSSLYDYCTRALKYCPASAQLRIDAMRLTREVPEVRAALESGSVTLSSVGVLRKHIRMEKTQNGRELSGDEKRSLFEQIHGQSKDQAERTLAAISPQALPEERVKVLTRDETEIRFVADAGLMELISEARAKLLQKGQSGVGMAEIFEYALRKTLGHPVEKRNAASSNEVKQATSLGEVKPTTSSDEVKSAAVPAEAVSREAVAASLPHGLRSSPSPNTAKAIRRSYIPRAIRRALEQKTGRQCTYISPITAHRCSSTHALQIEHIQPFALGGGNELANLTLLCPAHNRLRAVESFGERKMLPYFKQAK